MTLTVISLESVVEDKKPWVHALRELAKLPPDTPCAGVLTTDVKIRLWPRMMPATVGGFGLYVHAPDYDLSRYVRFDLAACLRLIDIMTPMLAEGYAKASLWYGLGRDFQRYSKDPQKSAAWESMLEAHRHLPEFMPAALMAGVTKEDKKSEPSKGPSEDPESAAAKRNKPDKNQLELL